MNKATQFGLMGDPRELPSFLVEFTTLDNNVMHAKPDLRVF